MKIKSLKYLVVWIIFFSSGAIAQKVMDANTIMEKMDNQQRNVSDGTFTQSRLSTCRFAKKDKKISCVETPRIKLMESVSKQSGLNKKDSKNISILLEPASERGIGMLSYSYDDNKKDSESWLYLSALGKVKRIASGSSDDQEPTAIFGSEFSTEDMESGKTDEYRYKILQQGLYAGRSVWVIESLPKPARLSKTDYSKILVWVDKERLLPLKMQTYDKRGKVYKRLLFKNIVNIQGYWLARDVTVLNLKTLRLSNMKTEKIALNRQVSEQFLTQRTLTDFAFREKELAVLRELVQ
ncbi:MAG: outer membrane lipoprotein-sorting protein [Bermanella sp.]